MDEDIGRRTLTILMLSTIITLIIVFSPLISSSNVNPQATIVTPIITRITPISPIITPITPITVTIVPSFTLSASPTSITVIQGGEGYVTVTVDSIFGFSSPVSFSSTSPSGIAVSFTPSSITPPANGRASTTARISVGRSVGVGTYSITIYGVSGTLSKSISLTLVVKEAPTTPTTPTPSRTPTPPPREFNILSFLPYIILAIVIIIAIVLAIILLRRKKPAPPPPAAPAPKPPEPTRRYCMHCGAIMPRDALFCPNCGKQPPGGPDTKTCPNCGSVINLVASYCPKCGAAQPKQG